MRDITIKNISKKIKNYSEEEKEAIIKAYNMADSFHDGQMRESGEKYISHPLNVAYILAKMHADCDTICAALLHDTLEDTDLTKEEIEREFNSEVAKLVDGVTKISKLNFSSKQDQNLANTRKIITSVKEDVRIIIIKLADRLHNMRTLQFKSEFKQKENAIETMEIFVPFAYCLGAYQIKSELEDISFKYLEPEIYKNIEYKKEQIELDSLTCIKNMFNNIKNILDDNKISNQIESRTKNIYGIYKKLEKGYQISDIHDLLAFKIMVNNIEDCYKSLGLVHSLYHPINQHFKDYICNPKTNNYRSLHTTVFGPNERIVQTQIRTFEMNQIDSFGLTAYWYLNSENARDVMQQNLKNQYQFYKSLTEIDRAFHDNHEFIDQVKTELFSEKIYAYTTEGETIELPKGSTPIDFAYSLDKKSGNTEFGNTMVGATVNDQYVSIEDYQLKNKDRVKIITDNISYGPRLEWLDKVNTTYAKRKIKEFKYGKKY